MLHFHTHASWCKVADHKAAMRWAGLGCAGLDKRIAATEADQFHANGKQ